MRTVCHMSTPTQVELKETNWGRMSNKSSLTYAFETATGSRIRQDVGLNGLSTADEHDFPTL